jgi:transposase-like protein
MLAGLSSRRYTAGLEPAGQAVEAQATATSKSAVSRRFVAATETALADLMARRLDDLDLVAFMVDGVHFGEHTCVVALGIGIDGTKHPLAVEEGSTENATLVTDLITGLRDRGLDVTKPVLAVLDGAKALSRAVKDVFDQPLIQRCQQHKIKINRPSRSSILVGGGTGQLRRSRCCWRLLATRWCRAASSFQPRAWASACRALMSSSWRVMTSAAPGSGTKLSHCSQMLA